jgi:tetratricopeptide (TPR) repeat protein
VRTLISIALLVATVGITFWFWPRAASPERIEQLIAAKHYDTATRAAEEWLASHPNDPKVLYDLARARSGAGDHAGCIEAAHRIPAWSLRKAAALLFAGKSYRQLHQGRKSEENFQQAIARDPSGPAAMEARLELLGLYAMQERRQAFLNLVWRIYGELTEAERLLVLTMRLRIEFEQVHPETNAAILSQMVEHDPEDANAVAGLAATYVHSGSLDDARKHYETAVSLAPDDPELRERLCGVLQQRGDTSALANVLEAVDPTSIGRAATWRFVGVLAQSRRDLPAATKAFEHAIALDPLDLESHHRLSQILFQQAKKAEAEAHAAKRDRLRNGRESLHKAWDAFANAYERDSNAVPIPLFLDLARGCAASGLDAEALACYREIARRDPSNEEARDRVSRAENTDPGRSRAAGSD